MALTSQLQLPSDSAPASEEGGAATKETTVASDSGDTSLILRWILGNWVRKGKALTGTDLQNAISP